MVRDLTVVKIGGSLVAEGGRLRSLLRALADGAEGPCVVVPGGGGLADAVRAAQAALAFDDALAHRLALSAMAGTARILAALEPRLSVATDPGAALARGEIPVWDPSPLIDGHPDIPETWDVTSDSLALWLAAELRAARCLIVKSADPPRDDLLDAAFPVFAARFSGDILVRGPGREWLRAGSARTRRAPPGPAGGAAPGPRECVA
ncbi:MAG: uridylate kinase [Methylobacterium frigidaeris]